MIAIATSNEEFYGKARYVMVSFDTFNAYLFPLSSEQIISIGCTRPSLPEEIAAIISMVLAGR
jgi:hypothetical protein